MSTTTKRCAACRKRTADPWAWQPFGPGSVDALVLPGSHYRGFPCLPLCTRCAERGQRGEQLTFTYRGQPYLADFQQDTVYPCPF